MTFDKKTTGINIYPNASQPINNQPATNPNKKSFAEITKTDASNLQKKNINIYSKNSITIH